MYVGETVYLYRDSAFSTKRRIGEGKLCEVNQGKAADSKYAYSPLFVFMSAKMTEKTDCRLTAVRV